MMRTTCGDNSADTEGWITKADENQNGCEKCLFYFFTEKRKTIFSESDLRLRSGAKDVGWGVS